MRRNLALYLSQCIHLALALPYFKTTTSHAVIMKRESEKKTPGFIVEAVMIPFLVILSGILAGLTLGYMSLDETQLQVLAISGSEKQQKYAKKIQPIRKNGHLLLTTLLLANMIVNETLPVLSEKVLGGGIQAVVVSTVLIVIFSEIIPQSLCSRYGLVIGAYMAVPTQCLIYALFIFSWPVAKVLHFVLGPHQGIVYRRNELKELINMHAAVAEHGGDLKEDTVAIVSGALDFESKTVFDAMTPIDKVFMLRIDAKLDYETLARVVRSGHSRVPVFEVVEVGGVKSKKILGILLVKQCVLLDPEDATPLNTIPLNKVPIVSFDEPLLGILDRFQTGHSHMAIVSRIPRKTESKAEQGSVDEDVKVGLTRRFLNRVGFGEKEDSSDEEESVEKKGEKGTDKDVNLEQTMPSDAVLSQDGVQRFLKGVQSVPLGIITLEDVLEELIGEEILDEFDLKGNQALAASSFIPEEAQQAVDAANAAKAAQLSVSPGRVPRVAQGLNAFRKTKVKRANSLPASPTNPSAFDPMAQAPLIVVPVTAEPASIPIIRAPTGPLPPGTPKKPAFKSLGDPEAVIPGLDKKRTVTDSVLPKAP